MDSIADYIDLMILACVVIMGYLIHGYLSDVKKKVYEVAVHEAGHAIVAWHSPILGYFTEAVVDGGAYGGGHVNYRHKGNGLVSYHLHECCICLAGLAAEHIVLDSLPFHRTKYDLTEAIMHTKKTMRFYAPGKHPLPWDMPVDPDRQLDSSMFDGLDVEQIEKDLMFECFLYAVYTLREHEKAFTDLTEHLRKHRFANTRMMNELCGPSPHADPIDVMRYSD